MGKLETKISKTDTNKVSVFLCFKLFLEYISRL